LPLGVSERTAARRRLCPLPSLVDVVLALGGWFRSDKVCSAASLSWRFPLEVASVRSALRWIKEEMLKMLPAVVFFAAAFSLLVLNERVTVRGSAIEATSFAKALVGALIVAKVLLLVNLLPFINRFPDRPLVYNICWKTSLYLLASLPFRYLDAWGRTLFLSGSLAVAHQAALEEFTRPRFWMVEIWLGVLLAVFVTAEELVRVFGTARLRQVFVGR
jgi:hypothetical protein